MDAPHERNLPYQRRAAAFGLPKDEALKAETCPAQILGVSDRVSLEVGKDASLIVTNGDPLEVRQM